MSPTFFFLDAGTGRERTRFQYPARIRDALDYGNSPRATPLIASGRAYLLGAFGHLHCVDVATGQLVWATHLAEEFGARRPQWGYAGSPLLVGERLIVQPGGPNASLVALDAATGDMLWESPGRPASYAGFITAKIRGQTQLIGLDSETLGGWDPATGGRLWELSPATKGDFNVPSPFMVGQRLFIASENNGARMHDFDAQGRLIAQPVAHHEALDPDAHTPVPVGEHIVGLGTSLLCLRKNDLRPAWSADTKLGTYAAMISDGKTLVLTLSDDCTLHLHDVSRPTELATLRLTKESLHLLAHPTLVGNRLCIRLGQSAVCLQL